MSRQKRNARKRKTKTTARVSFKREHSKPKVAPSKALTDIYWPDRIDYVKAVAAQGLTDVEMAAYLGVSENQLESWKAFYPLFSKAIDEGRSQADVEVIQALHKNAVGFEYTTDEVVKTRHGAEVVTATKFVPPDTQAQKFWLTNRSANWRQGQNVAVGGRKDAPPIAVSAETKLQVIHSILNMITPRPDGDGKAPRIINVTRD